MARVFSREHFVRKISSLSFLFSSFRCSQMMDEFLKNIRSKIRVGFSYEFYCFFFLARKLKQKLRRNGRCNHWKTIVHPRNVSRCEQYLHYEKFVERYLNLTDRYTYCNIKLWPTFGISTHRSINNEKLLKNCLKRFFSLLYETMDFSQPVEQAILIEITNRTLYKKKQKSYNDNVF